jgi:hypothetical protein
MICDEGGMKFGKYWDLHEIPKCRETDGFVQGSRNGLQVRCGLRKDYTLCQRTRGRTNTNILYGLFSDDHASNANQNEDEDSYREVQDKRDQV